MSKETDELAPRVMLRKVELPADEEFLRGLGNIDRLLPGLTMAEAASMPREEYCANVVAQICETALRYQDSPNAMFVNYSEQPEATRPVPV